jgi:hypothetical protein
MRTVCAAFAIAALTACGGGQPAPNPAAHAEATRIGFEVPNRSNAAASVAARGSIVAVVWSAAAESHSDIYLSASSDGGRTFGSAVRVNDVEGDARASGEQAARVFVGLEKEIHVVWPARREGTTVIRYSGSLDGGRTFSPAVSVAGAGLTGFRGWHAATLGYDGGVHLVWLDGRNAAPMHHQHGTRGQHGARGAKPAVREAPRQDIFHASWKGDLQSRAERPVAAHVCFCCKTAVATAGDRVYVAWRHIYPGGIRDIAMARSTDNGVTFMDPIRVSEDGWKLNACPDDGPAMVSDGHGGIHIAWPTLVAAEGAAPRKGVFYASLTPEQTFTPRLRLDSGDTDPAHPQIAAHEHGTSAVVWDERAGDRRRIVLREVLNGTAGPPMVFDGDSVSYPAVAAGDQYWIAVWAAEAADGRSVLEGRRIPFASKH